MIGGAEQWSQNVNQRLRGVGDDDGIDQQRQRTPPETGIIVDGACNLVRSGVPLLRSFVRSKQNRTKYARILPPPAPHRRRRLDQLQPRRAGWHCFRRLGRFGHNRHARPHQ